MMVIVKEIILLISSYSRSNLCEYILMPKTSDSTNTSPSTTPNSRIVRVRDVRSLYSYKIKYFIVLSSNLVTYLLRYEK